MAPVGGSDRFDGGIARLKRLLSSPGFRLSLALLVSALTLYLAIRPVDLAQVRLVFGQVDWRYVLLGVLSGSVGIGFKIGRWLLLLRWPEGARTDETVTPPGWKPVAASFLSAQMINNFFPLRLGEIGRVAIVGRNGVGYAFVAGSIAIEKALDLAAFAVVFGVLLVKLPPTGLLGERAYWLAGAGVLVLGLVMLAASQQKRLAGWLPENWNAWLVKQAHGVFTSLSVLRRPLKLGGLAGLTALIWWLAWWTNQLCLQALGLDLPASAALLVLVALQVGVSLPSLPGRVGVFEYVCILALQLFGIDPATALSYGILLHVVVYIPVVAGGLPALWMLPASTPTDPIETETLRP